MASKLSIWKAIGLVLSLISLAACQAGPEPKIYIPQTQQAVTQPDQQFVEPITAIPATPSPSALPDEPALPVEEPTVEAPVTESLIPTPQSTPDGVEIATGQPENLNADGIEAFPALNEARPYLIYYDEMNEQPEIVLLNTNLAGRRSLPLPQGSLPPRLPDALSPGGQWLVFQTGAPDPAMHLMSLPNGQTRRIDSLPEPDRMNWSPTGRYLAFTSTGAGPDQTEVLLYDRFRESVFRLGGGEAPVLWLSWSPDNNYVLFANASEGCDGDCGNWTAIDVRNGRTWQPELNLEEGQQVRMNGWRSPWVVSIVVASEGKSLVKTFNIYYSTETMVLDAPFVDYRYDSQTGLYAVIVDSYDESSPAQEPGIYLFDARTGLRPAALFSEYGKLQVRTWGRGGYRFLLWNESQIFRLDSRGVITAAANGTFMGTSPSGNWLVVMDLASEPPVLSLLNDNLQVVYLVDAEYAGDLFWSEDESTLFSIQEGKLYSLPLATGEWNLIDPDLPDNSMYWNKSLLYAWK